MTIENAPNPDETGLTPENIVPEETPIPNETETAPPKRRRGRPPGSASKSESEKGDAPKKTASRKAQDTDTLARQIIGIHQMAAMMTGIGELVISEPEAAMLAKGVNAVAEEYGLSFGGKTGAAIQLFAAAAMVYGPRALMINQRAQAERRAKAEQTAQQNGTIDGHGLVNPYPNGENVGPAH